MKILIVDDHPIVRKGISSALSFEKDVEKVLEASSLKEAMTLINAEKPELCIVDLYLGEEDGLELLKKAKYESGGVKFVILTSSLKKEDFIRAEEAGADGYILKDAFSEDILYAISVVLSASLLSSSGTVITSVVSSVKTSLSTGYSGSTVIPSPVSNCSFFIIFWANNVSLNSCSKYDNSDSMDSNISGLGTTFMLPTILNSFFHLP
jgi:DNA-binding NarL/FixJ family response regulator